VYGWRSEIIMRIVVALTGASGSVVGIRLVEELKKKNLDVSTIISKAGAKVIALETGNKFGADYGEDEIDADISSSSNKIDAFIICPCSMKTLSAVANGYTENLIVRLADNCLKMRRKLVVCIRDTPYNLMHIENMKKVTLAGGIVMPLNAAYYFNPKTVDDFTNFFVGKIMDILNMDHNLYARWNK